MTPNMIKEKTITGTEIRKRLSPAALMATSSLSKENRLNVVMVEMRQATGSVKTRNDGMRWTMMVSTEPNPTPFETRSSTSRSISLVKIIKHKAARLIPKGESSSRKMYLSRIVPKGLNDDEFSNIRPSETNVV